MITAVSPRAGRSRAAMAALLLAVLFSALPTLLVRIPPTLDYPNHYVRLWLLAGGIAQPAVAGMYAIDWSGASTNIVIDLIAAGLRGIAPMEVIGPLVLTLAIVLPPLGVALLGRRLFGALTWWHVLTFVLAWNWVLLAGFLSFEISLGLALIAAALDARWAARGAGALVPLRLIAGAFVLIAHPFGLLFYAALIGGLALGPRLAPLLTVRGVAAAVLRAALACVPIAVVVVLLVLFAPALPGRHTQGHAAPILWQEPSVFAYVSMLLTPIKTYSVRVDAMFGLIFAAPILVALAKRRLRIHWGLLIVTVLLFLGALVMPRKILGTGGIDTRLPCMFVLSLAAAVLPDFRLSRRGAALAVGLALAIVGVRCLWIGNIWVARQADFASLERALRHVPPGAAILPLEQLPSPADIDRAPLGRFVGRTSPVFWHYPTLAIMDRGAFVPNLFTAAGKQPIRVLPPWIRIAVAEGAPETVDALANPKLLATHPYLGRWRDCFDYILVVNADMANAAGPMPRSPAILLAADEGFARLYRIDRAGRTCR